MEYKFFKIFLFLNWEVCFHYLIKLWLYNLQLLFHNKKDINKNYVICKCWQFFLRQKRMFRGRIAKNISWHLRGRVPVSFSSPSSPLFLSLFLSLSLSLGIVARISAQNPRTERVDVLGHFPDFSIDIATSPVTSRECSRDAYERELAQARYATGLIGWLSISKTSDNM